LISWCKLGSQIVATQITIQTILLENLVLVLRLCIKNRLLAKGLAILISHRILKRHKL